MKNSKVIFTIMVLLIFTMDSLAQTKKAMTQNLDASKNTCQMMIKDSSVIHVFAKWKVKHYADQWLLSTALNYTILQPGTLEEKKGSGMITVNVENPGWKCL
ncbi:hypothetical protein H8S90_18825 [Olivibacter sp. SDN3]|uniref:hypothetical protein n=1 Tax=Olivibacter sp. SDN3 TaxID=2764720 RepID=UPI001650F70D|nr:hypothetical protein [Olivibacter sp. SDN3]QNL48803.1 hypothetical protein H8S90_18825 [Olivibacter sp. SDN3]